MTGSLQNSAQLTETAYTDVTAFVLQTLGAFLGRDEELL